MGARGFDLRCEPLGFRARDLPAAWRDAVVPPALIVARPARAGLLDHAFIEQARERAINRAGTHRQRAGQAVFDSLEDRVAVLLAVEQREQDFERDRGQGAERVGRPEWHVCIIHACTENSRIQARSTIFLSRSRSAASAARIGPLTATAGMPGTMRSPKLRIRTREPGPERWMS